MQRVQKCAYSLHAWRCNLTPGMLDCLTFWHFYRRLTSTALLMIFSLTLVPVVFGDWSNARAGLLARGSLRRRVDYCSVKFKDYFNPPVAA